MVVNCCVEIKFAKKNEGSMSLVAALASEDVFNFVEDKSQLPIPSQDFLERAARTTWQ